jgi:NADH dehydrogenase (ubiquinone) Fe-S protein 8
MLATSTRQLQRAATKGSAVVFASRSVVGSQQLCRRSYATPAGPPPKGFRLPRQPNWDEEKESTLDRMGKYFLMTEMARGMYLLMEQFFRPP